MTYAKLILLDPRGGNGASSQVFNLTGNRMQLGRSPDCPVRFDSNIYGGVSRYHALVELVSTDATGRSTWQLCDQDSANGTFVNGQQINGCVTLSAGDRIMLSQNGPQLQFLVEDSSFPTAGYQTVETPVPLPDRPLPPQSSNPTANQNPSFSQLIPVVSGRKDFKSFVKKGYVIPGVVLVLWVVVLFSLGDFGFFIDSLGIFLGIIGYSFIYRLCGKAKPWWEITVAMFITMLLMLIPWFLGPYLFFFRGILPGDFRSASNNFFSIFIAFFFGAGLSEELLKVISVFILMFVSVYLAKSSGRKDPLLGVNEPLDGIVLASASGLGFTLVETLTQYVPNLINDVALQLGGSADAIQAGQLQGVQLLVPRIIGSLAGHMAYSGYFGYFIGLSVLFPQRKWLILGIGCMTSSILHALWNTSAVTIGSWMLAVSGILSYVFLIAAILKARELSPTRAQNFATRIASSDSFKP